jgi:hypothetical protein
MKQIIQTFIFLVGINTMVCFALKPTLFLMPKLAPKDSAILLKLPSELKLFSVRDFALSPKQDELFITVEGSKNVISSIIRLTKNKQGWNIEMAPFSGKYGDLEPAFSSDGKTLYFVSNRPLNDTDTQTKDFDIWKTEKTNGVWSEPKNLGAPVNTDANEFYPSVTDNGRLYFTAAYKNSKGKEDIWMSKLDTGKYSIPISLSDSVNSTLYEFNAFVSSDDSFIIFTSYGREDGLGGGDLYISKKGADGNWTKAKNLGSKINSTALDYCPFVSFDKQYFFFTSERNKVQKSYKTKLSLNEFLKKIGQIQNGKGNIYWINAKTILK